MRVREIEREEEREKMRFSWLLSADTFVPSQARVSYLPHQMACNCLFQTPVKRRVTLLPNVGTAYSQNGRSSSRVVTAATRLEINMRSVDLLP